MQRQAPRRASPPRSLQLVLLAAGLVFSAAVATIYSMIPSQGSPWFSMADLAGRQAKLRVGVPPPPPPTPGRPVWWHAPFVSGGGMGREALVVALGLDRFTEYHGRVWATSHGDAERWDVFNGLDSSTQRALLALVAGAQAATLEDARRAIIVCHSEPGAWALPQPLYQTAPCPPVPLTVAAYVVGRTMFEAESLSAVHVERCNQMAEVWVPTDHARAVFASSGVDPGKLRVVPEPVDTEEFDPTKHRPLPLPLGTRVFGPAWPHVRTAAAAAAGGGGSATEAPFVFLSIFKWEARKGWDILLRAFLTAFTADDNVLLLLHTQPFHSDANFAAQMQARSAWAQRELPAAAQDLRRLPSVYVLGDHRPQRHFPRLFRAADCFVLPTRGEGWGLPIVEAMAMGLPVIATNHSGPTAYLDSTVGYPLPIEGLVEAHGGGAFEGHRWAQPSTQHLVALMRHVTDAAHRAEAAARGRAARRRMQERYGPEVVAQAVAAQLRRIERQLAQ